MDKYMIMAWSFLGALLIASIGMAYFAVTVTDGSLAAACALISFCLAFIAAHGTMDIVR